MVVGNDRIYDTWLLRPRYPRARDTSGSRRVARPRRQRLEEGVPALVHEEGAELVLRQHASLPGALVAQLVPLELHDGLG